MSETVISWPRYVTQGVTACGQCGESWPWPVIILEGYKTPVPKLSESKAHIILSIKFEDIFHRDSNTEKHTQL